jgi:hypothetical protein
MSAWLEELTKGSEFGRFIELTERYCSICECVDSFTLPEFLQEIDAALPQVYGAAAVLTPHLWDYLDEQENDVSTSSAEKLSLNSGMYDLIRAKLGYLERYSLVFDSYNSEDNAAIDGTLADDLASIYAELKLPLALYRSGREPEIKQALWEWGFDRKVHWGRHATHAMAAVYSLIHTHYDEDDEVFDI